MCTSLYHMTNKVSVAWIRPWIVTAREHTMPVVIPVIPLFSLWWAVELSIFHDSKKNLQHLRNRFVDATDFYPYMLPKPVVRPLDQNASLLWNSDKTTPTTPTNAGLRVWKRLFVPRSVNKASHQAINTRLHFFTPQGTGYDKQQQKKIFRNNMKD